MIADSSHEQAATHRWDGLVGPHPDLVTVAGVTLIVLAGVPLVASTPSWWATTVGPLALAINAAAAFWHGGAHRLVTVGSTGIRIERKARWSQATVGESATMPRMPIGPMKGRWCRCNLAGVWVWIHHSQFAQVDKFDHEFRNRFVVG